MSFTTFRDRGAKQMLNWNSVSLGNLSKWVLISQERPQLQQTIKIDNEGVKMEPQATHNTGLGSKHTWTDAGVLSFQLAQGQCND